MNLIQSIILGIVEGVTEFLPVSSTAHLILTSKLLGLSQDSFQTFFEVFIQSAAIFAVVFLYAGYVLKNTYIVKQIITSFIPTAVVGLVLHKVIKEFFFESETLILGSLFVVGIVFVIVEYLIKKKKIILSKDLEKLTLSQSVIIGLIQAIAVVPGVSRAGAVIIGMMLLGYKREEAARYSFLLAIPTIFAASALDLLKLDKTLLFSGNNLQVIIVGSLAAFITAYFSLRWFMDFLKKKSLVIFAFYRWAVVLLFILFGFLY